MERHLLCFDCHWLCSMCALHSFLFCTSISSQIIKWNRSSELDRRGWEESRLETCVWSDFISDLAKPTHQAMFFCFVISELNWSSQIGEMVFFSLPRSFFFIFYLYERISLLSISIPSNNVWSMECFIYIQSETNRTTLKLIKKVSN